MPAPTTNDELLDLVRKSGVIDEKRLATQLERIRAAGEFPPEPGKFAGVLVRDGVLTHFQAEQFLQGKWRRFTIGKYKVLERLGAGGMGSVYLCEHTLMRRRVAVKVLPANTADDSSSLKRFHREAQAVAALDHPNIVRAYDIGEDNKLHFLVMEHVDGSSLQEIIKKAGPLDPIRAAHYIRQAALGLQHAHETAGIVHRDIKPGNILVDRNGIVKVLDMGLARFFHDEEDQLTKQFDENVLGTADYLAPEQAIESHSATIRADIYSLGGTFYWCLAGRTPFTEGSVAQKLIWHQTRQPKSIRTYRADIPDGLVAVLEKMMAKQADDRYQTPQEVADALEPWTRTPIPPPPEKEMPNFSLAAMASLKPGEASMTAARAAAAESPGVGKNWQVSGSATPTTTNAAAPTAPVAPRLPSPPTPRPAPVSPPPRSAPPPPPTPRPVAPSRIEEVAPPTPQPVAVSPPPSGRSSNGRAAPGSSPRVIDPEFSTARTTAPVQVAEPEPAVQEDSEDAAVVVPTRRPERKRAPRVVVDPKKSKLPLLLGIGGGITAVVAAVAIYFLVFSKPADNPTDPKKPQRVVHRIAANTSGGITAALKKAKEGDLILLEGDIREARVEITIPNLTIEADSGRKVTWSYPTKAPEGFKLLLLSNVSGFQLRNVTLDGDNKAEALVIAYGKCHGTLFDKVQLKNATKYGIVFPNCSGTAESPVRLTEVAIPTNKPTDTAIRFDYRPSLKEVMTVNAHFDLRGVSFSGPGRKVTTPNFDFVDRGTIELPSGVSVETAP
jgi:serine/threonine protein kinase